MQWKKGGFGYVTENVWLGGASFMGGQGNAIGSFIGAVVMITIYNGCDLLPNVNSNWTKVIVGLILIITVSVDQFRKHRSGEA